MNMATKVIRVVLTGGPCGGKTSALKALQAFASSRGLSAYVVPETPSMVISAGIPYPGTSDPGYLLEFETGLARAQTTMESVIQDLAISRGEALGQVGPAVLLMDRSLLDMRAYMSIDIWAAMLARLNIDEDAYRRSIDLVLHLQTAAEGALEAYTCSNNSARSETADQARELDAAVWVAYDGHRRRFLIPNPSEGGFAAKLGAMEATMGAVLDEISRK
jgi:predicted ATPase